MRIRSLIRHAGLSAGRIVRAAFDAVLPVRCPFCGDFPENPSQYICEGCFDDLPRNSPCCPRCAAATVIALPDGVLCGDCQANPPPFDAAVAPLEYAFPVDAAVKRLKFDRKLFYAPAFARLMADALAARIDDAEALQPVPLHRWRQLRRGFNQAHLLAGLIGRRLSLPMCDLVDRTRSTPSQSGLDRAARRRNLRGAFRLRARTDAEHVVIVDDVMTTGETGRRVAAMLRRSGVPRISMLALARAQSVNAGA